MADDVEQHSGDVAGKNDAEESSPQYYVNWQSSSPILCLVSDGHAQVADIVLSQVCRSKIP